MTTSLSNREYAGFDLARKAEKLEKMGEHFPVREKQGTLKTLEKSEKNLSHGNRIIHKLSFFKTLQNTDKWKDVGNVKENFSQEK